MKVKWIVGVVFFFGLSTLAKSQTCDIRMIDVKSFIEYGIDNEVFINDSTGVINIEIDSFLLKEGENYKYPFTIKLNFHMI